MFYIIFNMYKHFNLQIIFLYCYLLSLCKNKVTFFNKSRIITLIDYFITCKSRF